MLPRHANRLLEHLEDVVDVGCTVIRKAILLRWYGHERLTVGIWRDIQQKWSEVKEEAGLDEEDKRAPLFAAEGDGHITLVWGQGLTATGEGAWLRDISDLVGIRRI